METLLSLSFDNISSTSPDKIRKGLRQIEGLLAQICLSSSSRKTSASSRPGHRRNASALPSSSSASPQAASKTLAELPEDPAFREFFRLQNGFEWNVATRLVACLERLLGMPSSGANDLLLFSAVTLLHGALLLHPPSRKIFEREIYMNLLLDLLDTSLPPSIQSATLSALSSALLSHPPNARVFEATDGLLTVTSLYKSQSTPTSIRAALNEFLYLYLLPEAPTTRAPQSEPNTAVRRKGSISGGARRADTMGDTSAWDDYEVVAAAESEVRIRTAEEKRRLLTRYVRDVDGLVAGLRKGASFEMARRGAVMV